MSDTTLLRHHIFIDGDVPHSTSYGFYMGGGEGHNPLHSGKSAKIRESNHSSGVCKEHYA